MIQVKFNNRIEGRNIVSDIHNLPYLNSPFNSLLVGVSILKKYFSLFFILFYSDECDRPGH